MANLQKEKKDAMGYIDVAITILEKYPNLEEINLDLSISPFTYLIDICKSLGIYDQMLQWLVKFLTSTLPAVELGIKGIILSNIKATISCSSDPRIPGYMRKLANAESSDRGIILDINALDPYSLLYNSPLTEDGKHAYFGTENMTSVYQLARAKDFNAFMWFAIHKSSFPTPTRIRNMNFSNWGAEVMNGSTSLLKETVLMPTNEDEGTKILQGTTFIPDANNNRKLIALCIEASRNVEGKIAQNTIVPVSNDNRSANWYVDSGTYFDFLKPEKSRKPRNYSDEYAICNLRYMNTLTESGAYFENTRNKLQFTILPKPFVHLPRNGEPAWRIQRILFNADGEPDKNGKYSCVATFIEQTDDGVIYDVEGITNLVVMKQTGNYFLHPIDETIAQQVLYECYPKLTVYEFNYDFVMGMQLFDAKTISTNLINLALGIEVGMSLNYSKKQLQGRQRVAEVVKNIIESETSEVSDCYYTFSNDKYNEMIHNAEMKNLKQEPFENGTNTTSKIDTASITDILNEYNSEGTLEENRDVLTRAFNQISASIQDEVLPNEYYALNADIIVTLIQNLTQAIVEVILSPKILLLFEVNKRLMGDNNETLSFEDLLKLMMNVIVSIVKEIRDLILAELLKFVLEQLRPIFELLADKLLLEQVMFYKNAIALLIKECGSIRFGKRANLDSELDIVNYADIDPNPTEPTTSECG